MIVCHCCDFEGHCGNCSKDGVNCLDLAEDRRVVCQHGTAGGPPWQGVCANCVVNGPHCAVIGLLQRVVCVHGRMLSGCGSCTIDGRNCLVLDPGAAVVCHHHGGEGYCGSCQLSGMPSCWTTQRAYQVVVEWDLAREQRIGLPRAQTIAEVDTLGPGVREIRPDMPLPRSRTVSSAAGRPIAIRYPVNTGYPELTANSVRVDAPIGTQNFGDRPTWDRRFTQTLSRDCPAGTWRFRAICTAQTFKVPFKVRAGGAEYRGIFTADDYYDLRLIGPEPVTTDGTPGLARMAEVRRVCQHGRYEKHCGNCGVDGVNCIDLGADRRVVCQHGSADSGPWRGLCRTCSLDGSHCAIIGLLQRVVCVHEKMLSACAACKIDGQNCLVLDPNEVVVCHHHGGEAHCGSCLVDGIPYCWKTQRAAAFEIVWGPAQRFGVVKTLTLEQLDVEGPGRHELKLAKRVTRTRVIASTAGRPLTLRYPIHAGFPEIQGNATGLGATVDWHHAFADPATWERRFMREFVSDCLPGRWRLKAVCSVQKIKVPLTIRTRGVEYRAFFVANDFFDPRLVGPERVQIVEGSVLPGLDGIPEVKRVCHHGHYESHCGACYDDGESSLELDAGRRVVCEHGDGSGPWRGACDSCRIDGTHCASIGLFQRVVCHHNRMESACGSCAIDGTSCLVLEPGQVVVCHHHGGGGYCGSCRVSGMPLCWTTQRPGLKIEVQWDLALAKRSEEYTATIGQTCFQGPGQHTYEYMNPFVRYRSISSPTGRPLLLDHDIVTGFPERTAKGKIERGSERSWLDTFNDDHAWERPIALTGREECGAGAWEFRATCTWEYVEVPFSIRIGAVEYPAVFTFSDLVDKKVERLAVAVTPPRPLGEKRRPVTKVCHCEGFEGYCGACGVDGRYCIELRDDERVVSRLGAVDGRPWQGARPGCQIDGMNTAVIGMFHRVTCHHHQYQDVCGECHINGIHCRVEPPPIVQGRPAVEIVWDLDGEKRVAAPQRVTIGQAEFSGPGRHEARFEKSVVRAGSIAGVNGRSLVLAADIVAGCPELAGSKVRIGGARSWARTFAGDDAWERSLARTDGEPYAAGVWRVEAVCARHTVTVPFWFKIGAAKYPAVFTFTDYSAPEIERTRIPGLDIASALNVSGNGWMVLGDQQARVVGDRFTQEAWIQPKMTDDAFYGVLGYLPEGEDRLRAPSLWVCERRRIYFAYGDGVGQQRGLTRPVLSGEPGRWHHIAASFDGGTYRIYVDSALIHTQQMTRSPVTTPVRWIGRADACFVGGIADVRLWTVTRTQAEIRTAMACRLRGDEPGLIGYWPLADSAPEGLLDRARDGVRGVLVGDARIDHPRQAPWSSVLRLQDGDYVELPESAALVLGSTFTQEAWILPDLYDDGYHGFLGNQPQGDVARRSPSLWVHHQWCLHFGYGDGLDQQHGSTGAVLMGELGRWRHVAASFDGSTYRIYVDGALVQTLVTNKPPVASQVKWIGRVDNCYTGAIADVRLWTVARTQAEIQAAMRRRLTGSETGLVGYWLLDDGAGAQLLDRAGSNHGRLLGAPRWQDGLAPTTPEVEAPALPSEVVNLRPEIRFLFVPFDLPIEFAGAVAVRPVAREVSYIGRARLTAPFDISVDPLELTLAAGPKWLIKFKLPPARSLKDVIEGEVVGRLPDGLRHIVELLVLPFLPLCHEPTFIFASEEGEDGQLGEYVAGTNIFSSVNAAEVALFTPIHEAFPMLGLDDRTLVLAIQSSSGQGPELTVGATLELECELGTPAVVIESIGLSVGTSASELKFAAQVTFRLTLADEVLKLRGGVETSGGSSSSVSIWGALDAADGAWEEPFGVPGVTITGLGVVVGATQIGVRGGVRIGDSLLDANVAIKLDASDWSKCILVIESEEGLGLPRLVGALIGQWLRTDAVPRAQIRDLQIYIAPKGGTIADERYAPGLKVRGTLDLLGLQATVAGQLDFDEGGTLRGGVDPIILSAGGFEFLRISSAVGDGGASIAVVLTRSEVGGAIDGRFRLFNGLYETQVQAALTTSGFTATLRGDGLGMYRHASVTLEAGLYRLAFAPAIRVELPVVGFKIMLPIDVLVTTELDHSSFSQSISFTFSAMGESYSLGPFSYNVPFRDLDDLVQAFYRFVGDLLAGSLVAALKLAAKLAFEWVKFRVTAIAEEAARLFKSAGAAALDIAKGMVETFDTSAGEAVKMLSLGADEAGRILREGFGYTVREAGEFIWGGYNLGSDGVRTALYGAGYAASEIDEFFGDFFSGLDDLLEDLEDLFDF